MFERFIRSIEWRVRAVFGNESLDNTLFNLGLKYRALSNKKQVYFGIAGSVGKTSTKDLLLGILSSKAKTVGNRGSLNRTTDIANIILRVRPWHKFCVAELGETAPDSLDDLLTALQPSIGIVTVVGDDHLSAFGSREAITREFAKLIRAIPAHGTVVLNLDDTLVSSLREDAKCRVITYGTCATADLQATEIVSTWPEPLQFTANHNGESIRIRTQLYGRQLLTSALAAIGGGLAADLTLADCANGISQVAPVEGRMQPAHGPRGITVIRDDFKSPAWTVRPLLEQLGSARANRKILVLGTISDCQHKEHEFFKLALEALKVADIAIFTGHLASAALKACKPETESQLHAYSRIVDAATLLQSIQQDGDLILLKGTNKKDHLSRIALSMTQTVNCWVDDCGRDMFCSECSHLQSHRGPPNVIAQVVAKPADTSSRPRILPIVAATDQIIIGLGNPGVEYAGTPHNLGYESLDALCSSISSEWKEYPEAWIANGEVGLRNLWLVKVKIPMNLIGPILKKLADDMHIGVAQCILVFDDINLPIGSVRTRMNGSSGGHRGLTSVLEAFQTDQFRRIKIGVKRAPPGQPSTSTVLNRLDETAYATIRQSFETVKEQIFQLASQAR